MLSAFYPLAAGGTAFHYLYARNNIQDRPLEFLCRPCCGREVLLIRGSTLLREVVQFRLAHDAGVSCLTNLLCS